MTQAWSVQTRWQTVRWSQALLLLLMAWCLAGCRRVENPNQEKRSTPPTLFFNYYIENSAEPAARARRERFQTNVYAGLTLKVYTLANYFPSSLVEEFTRRYGGDIKLVEYETDQELQDRVAAGERPDVFMPTANGVARFIQRGLLIPLDHGRLSNLRHIAREFSEHSGDPHLKYSLPYYWSTAGIAYNSARLDFIPHTWGELFNPTTTNHNFVDRIALIPGAMRAYSAVLAHLGYSIDTTNATELARSAEYLARQTDRYRFRFLRAKTTDALVTEQVWMAQTYSSEASRAHRRNKNILFVVPEEGSWLLLESLVIPVTTQPKQVAMAHAFFNYLLEPTVAAEAVEFSHHATTVSAAKAYIDPMIKLGAAYNRSDKTPWQEYNPAGQAMREQQWRSFTNHYPAAIGH